MDELKRCSKCREMKPLDAFYRNRVMADGRSNQCVVCFKATHKSYRDSEKGKERQARYDASEKGKRQHNAACSTWRQTEKGKAYYADYYRRCKEKNRARGRVFDAVRSGRMQPATSFPCAHCGQPALEYHHHNGYDDAHSFDVIPLCKACHTATEHPDTIMRDPVNGDVVMLTTEEIVDLANRPSLADTPLLFT